MHLVILVRTESLEEGDVNFVLLQASPPSGQGCVNLAVVELLPAVVVSRSGERLTQPGQPQRRLWVAKSHRPAFSTSSVELSQG
jgi:hypothetical protein